jgi:hypothetical protein
MVDLYLKHDMYSHLMLQVCLPRMLQQYVTLTTDRVDR